MNLMKTATKMLSGDTLLVDTINGKEFMIGSEGGLMTWGVLRSSGLISFACFEPTDANREEVYAAIRAAFAAAVAVAA